MPKKTAIVVTTIFEPRFLAGYMENIQKHGHTADVDMIVIIDRKTPASVGALCARYAAQGFSVLCPTLEEQESFLGKFPSMRDVIPYDSDNRRNIGYLMALERGAEVLISIDDDNYCLPDVDFVTEHHVVGRTCIQGELRSEDRWFNIANMLHGNTKSEIYARGFPYFARHRQRRIETSAPSGHRVAINAGLWLSDPDVDAITRLSLAPRIASADEQPVLLGPQAWSPVNTQNTALAREVVAAYYYVRMGYSLGGMSIDRYGDILSGYFVQKCVHSMGEVVRVGSPVADHRRSPHNLFKDLYHELAGMVIIEELLPWLMDLRLPASSYAEAYAGLADEISARAPHFSGFVWDQGAREFLLSIADNMRAWVRTIGQIG